LRADQIAWVYKGMYLDGNWHEDEHLFQAFEVAILTLLSRFKPSGSSPNSCYWWCKPDDPPEIIGRVHAGFA